MAGTETTCYKDTPIDDLIPYARNARTHSEDQINKVASSIKEFGFLNPIIKDSENGIIAGHCRVEAAKKLGYTQVPTIEASHLTDEQKRAYILADNRLALDAGWDNDMLSVEFAELHEEGFDLELTGFDAEEIGEVSPEPLEQMPELNDEDRRPIQQVTFTLHDEQAEQVETALETAKNMGDFGETGNENQNGNALARICETYVTNNGQG